MQNFTVRVAVHPPTFAPPTLSCPDMPRPLFPCPSTFTPTTHASLPRTPLPLCPDHQCPYTYFTAPLGLLHCTAYDTEFMGYSIAKDTIVMANFYTGHVDPETFIHPLTFAPERWLPPVTTNKPAGYLPFSCG